MRKTKTQAILLVILILISLASHAQQAIAQPYYTGSTIRFYNKSNPVAASPCYTLDLSSDINANWGTTSGINDVLLYDGKLFVSIDNGNGEGGVLVYNYANVYPAKTAGPVSVINPQNSTGLPVAGIAIQPGTGDLFVGTFYTGASDAGIYTYTESSGYANSSATQLASYYNDASIDQYIADLTFDASGNLWFTEFDGTNNGTSTAYEDHFLICFKAANKNDYYKIVNTSTQAYSTTALAGGAGPSVFLLSQPEGIAFDASGNLWLGNNNDDYACNTAGDGTLVKISSSWIIGTLFSQAYASTNTVPTADATVEYIPGGKLGGMIFDGNNLYINDQGQNQGSSYTSSGTVWKYNTTTSFNSTNFAASGIHTTYPGNGLMALDNSQFSVASDCYPSAEKNILTFTISGQVGSSTIDTTAATVAVLMPYTANLASLTPTITVSPNATISPLTGVAENFTTARTYTVTAQNNTTKSWTVTVTKQPAPSSEKNILTFTIPSQVGNSTVDSTLATVVVLMPYTANLASLTPTITVSAGATISPLSGVAENFTTAYTYTVTAADASTKSWTVTVTKQPAPSDEKNVLTFTISGQVGSSVIDTSAATVAVLMPAATNLTSLTPAITVSPGATINPLSGAAENFSSAYTYTVTAADATTKSWTVTVTKQSALSDSKNILTFTIPSQIGTSVIDSNNATVTVLMPSTANLASLVPAITVSPGASISPLSGVAENFTAPYDYTVTAADGTSQSWTVTVTKQAAISSEKNILSFAITNQVGTSVIDTANATVALVMPAGTVLTSLIPSITVSTGASISPQTGVAENFSAPYNYTVTAADGSTEVWTVSVSDQPSGISNVSGEGEDVSLYPNPASDRVFIKVSAPASIRIYNGTGTMVQQMPYDNESLALDISSFAAGVYLARLQFADGSVVTKRFVKE